MGDTHLQLALALQVCGEILHEKCHRILGALSRSSMNGTKAAGDRRMQSGGGQP